MQARGYGLGMKWHEVTLDRVEMLQGAVVGLMRCLSSFEQGHENKHGMEGMGIVANVQAARAELVVAIGLDIPWGEPVDTFKEPDLPGGIQVRWAPEHHLKLLLRPGDSPWDRYVLVTGKNPYRIQGWIKGQDGMQPSWWGSPNERPKAWWVPQHALKRLERESPEDPSGADVS